MLTPHYFAKYLSIVLGAALLAACPVKPVSEKREPALLSEADELRLGRDQDLEIRKQYGVYTNARLQAYVQKVGERLAAHSQRAQLQYSFTVLDSPQVNAFALPGGYVYVTRGVLAHLNSEAELAALLGHEIGHVSARHALRQPPATLANNGDLTLGAILAPELSARSGQSLLGTLSDALLAGYGREHELEANRLGAEYLARADYDPKAIIDVIGLLKHQEVFEKQVAAQEGRVPHVYHGVFTSHPDADERLQQVVAEAEKHRNPVNVRTERALYLKLIEGLTWGDSEAQGIRRGAEFYHRGLNIGVRFPAGWQVDNNPERLLAISPARDALLQMQVTEQGKARSPQEYLVVGMQRRDLRETRAFKVGGLPGYSGITRMQTPFGPRDVRVAVVFLNKQAFRFFAAERDAQNSERGFFETVQSLHSLSASERALARGLRVELVKARPRDSFAALAIRAGLTHEPAAALRMLNGKFPQGEPTPGELIKIIQ